MSKLVVLGIAMYVLYRGYLEYKETVRWIDRQMVHTSVKVKGRVTHSVNHTFDKTIDEMGENLSKGLDVSSITPTDTIELALFKK